MKPNEPRVAEKILVAMYDLSYEQKINVLEFVGKIVRGSAVVPHVYSETANELSHGPL